MAHLTLLRDKLTVLIDAHWRLIALAIGLAAFATSLSRMIRLARPPLSADNAMYLHMAWWVTRRGGRLYLDMWEPRPPLLYELFAVLALPAGDDPLLQYVISMTATLLFGVAVVVFIAQITFELTQHRGASVIAACARRNDTQDSSRAGVWIELIAHSSVAPSSATT